MTRRIVGVCLMLCAVPPFLFGLASSAAVTLADQVIGAESDENFPDFLRRDLAPKLRVAPAMTAERARTNWQEAIDATWGPSPLTSEERLDIFNTFWTTIDEQFACWEDLDVDWDALKSQYESEVAGDISRGRFAAIMNHLTLALKEAHTHARDQAVFYTDPEPGIPLLCYGRWGESGHFGAGLTPLPDSSLLVYKAVEDHPLGLEPGDRVLGYDGVPWKELYPTLIAEELPMTGYWWGCSPSAHSHSWLMAAGLNWHLFEAIDVVKYGTEDTLSLSVEPLIGQDMDFFCSEQMDVAGVPMPDYPDNLNDVVSWGILEEPALPPHSQAQIGYIYVWAWFGSVQQEFFNAIDSLMHHHDTDGLIIDFRMNYGGNMHLSNPGLELLFNETVLTVNFARRCNPDDHDAMCVWTNPSYFAIEGDSTTFYDKPIAILTGPGALSSGDFVAHRMKFHPMARFFGKSTTAAFNNPTDLNLGYSGWLSRYAMADAYEPPDMDHFLTHDEFEVDEAVWLTPDDVVLGIDTVVEAAVSWILQEYSSADGHPAVVKLRLSQNWPNPFCSDTSLRFALPERSHVALRIYDSSGRLVRTMLNDVRAAGIHTAVWDGRNQQGHEVTSGSYYYELASEVSSERGRMLRVR